jgi:hypothetical protein
MEGMTMKRALAILAILAVAGSVSWAGAIPGPKRSQSVIRPGGVDEYKVVFRAGELASVAVIGDGDTDLDLYVYDENGNLVVADEDGTDDCLVRWTPRWTGKYTIHVVNRGRLANGYGIATN